MPEMQIGVNVAYGVAIDVANDVLPDWWVEIHPYQSNSMLIAEIKCYTHNYVEFPSHNTYLFVEESAQSYYFAFLSKHVN